MFGWRKGIIYAYSVIDPKTERRLRWGYVGKTRQMLVNRHNQHMKTQPWSDLYPEVRIVWEFSSCPDWWLTMFEKFTIKCTKPYYNYEYNTKNPRRVPKYEAVAQRQARDLGLRPRGRRGRVKW